MSELIANLGKDRFITGIEQGSDAWHDLRRGIPTASQFGRILTEVKGEIAKGRWTYACELVAARLIQEDRPRLDGLRAVDRGKMLEPNAVKHYEKLTGTITTGGIAFVYSENGKFGCSPDRIFVNPNSDLAPLQRLGGVEFKCPESPQHLIYFNDGGPGSDYRWQVVGNLLVTGFETWDWMSYHPNWPEVLVRYRRKDLADDIKKLETAMKQFNAEVDSLCEKLIEAGFVSPVGQMATRPQS